ncbi:ATP-binding protein [Actinoplanes sp. NPDC020271]|uniref:ATP-binding protein n=1 Tax=Actinoplanes sp. NPDC020271 TaxID=3363896 RepID=UPI00379DA11A
MSFAARTLVEAVAGPAAIADEHGRVLVANSRWPGPAEGEPLAAGDPGCPAHGRLPELVRAARPGTTTAPACHCGPDSGTAVRVTGLESTCGAHRRLITVETAAAVDGRQQFLALLGHEVRTPVTTVVAAIDLLRAQSLPSDVRETVDTVHRAVRNLRDLTDDLLDLARLETGSLVPRVAPTAVRDVLDSVLEPLQQQARDRGLLLLASPAPELPAIVEADADRLRQILAAVVGNAVRFTERGEVVVTAEPDGADRCRLEVTDTGPGIAAVDQERIFEPFVQAGFSAARRHEGAGLGLPLARRLAACLGGTLTVSSEPGRGSRFTITLPLRALPGPAPSALPLAGRRIGIGAPTARSWQALSWLVTVGGAEAVRLDLDDLTTRRPGVDTVLWCDDAHDPAAVDRADAILTALGSAGRALMLSSTDPRTGVVRRPGLLSAPVTLDRLVAALDQQRTGVRGAPVTLPPLPAGRVLLAEDNEVNRTVLARMIRVLGVDCDTVADGAAAVRELLGDNRYQVALMDMQMPGTDGLEATRRVRSAGCVVPIVALTATALPEDHARCLAAGMDGYLTKPITLVELRRALSPYLAPTEAAAPATASPPVTMDTPATAGAPDMPAPVTPDAPASEPDREVLSWAQLRDLEVQLEGRELVAMTISTFLNELDGRKQAMAGALAESRHDRLGAVAHTLKSSSALLGAQPLADACARVERLAAAAVDIAVLAAAVSEVDRAAGAAAIAMTGYLDES